MKVRLWKSARCTLSSLFRSGAVPAVVLTESCSKAEDKSLGNTMHKQRASDSPNKSRTIGRASNT